MLKSYKKIPASLLLTAALLLGACGPKIQQVALDGPKPGKGAEHLALQEAMLSESNDCYDMELRFPVTGNPKIDSEIKESILECYEDYAASFKDLCGNGLLLGISVDYEVYAPSDGVVSFLFHSAVDGGGAHPMYEAAGVSFTLPEGERLEYDDIFEDMDGFYRFLSEYAFERLSPSLGEYWEQAPLLKEGLAPDCEACFESFVLTPDGLIVYFDLYQIAPYSAGAPELEVPLSELMRFGPRPGIWDEK